MVNLVKFEARHLGEIREQKAMAYLSDYWKPEHAALLERSPLAYTGIRENGKAVFCGGIVEYWDGRGEAWAVLDHDCRREFLAIHNHVRNFLNASPLRRIEATIDAKFSPGHRWVELLGFRCEGLLLRKYFPNGNDATLYARVK